VQHELCEPAAADAAVDVPEGCECERLEEREQHVELRAPRVVRELEGGEQQRGAERGGGAAEQTRTEDEREADQRDPGERRRQTRRHLRYATERCARGRGQPVVQRRLLRVGLAVQVQQHESARAELHRADRLGDVAVARFVRRPQSRAVEAREQQHRGPEEQDRSYPGTAGRSVQRDSSRTRRIEVAGSPRRSGHAWAEAGFRPATADVTFATAEVPHGRQPRFRSESRLSRPSA
jgi:hypothetical protein